MLSADKFEISFSKSSGPGGQNVNKGESILASDFPGAVAVVAVSTKAEIRFKLDDALWLPSWTRENLRKVCSGLLITVSVVHCGHVSLTPGD